MKSLWHHLRNDRPYTRGEVAYLIGLLACLVAILVLG